VNCKNLRVLGFEPKNAWNYRTSRIVGPVITKREIVPILSTNFENNYQNGTKRLPDNRSYNNHSSLQSLLQILTVLGRFGLSPMNGWYFHAFVVNDNHWRRHP
jgi:hypothetical protein